MAALVDAAVEEVMAALAIASSITAGLFVRVCGPESLVRTCKDAVRDNWLARRGTRLVKCWHHHRHRPRRALCWEECFPL